MCLSLRESGAGWTSARGRSRGELSFRLGKAGVDLAAWLAGYPIKTRGELDPGPSSNAVCKRGLRVNWLGLTLGSS